jgi:flagellar biosynthesis/type III secretory pathway chaperone
MKTTTANPLMGELIKEYQVLCDLLVQLQEALTGEREALRAFSPERTFEVAEEKSSVAKAIEKAEKQRLLLLNQIPELDVPPGSDGRDAMFSGFAPLDELHQRYQELLEACRIENRQNGLQIRFYSQKTSAALATLTGDDTLASPTSYTSSGDSSEGRSSRSLGRA